MTRRIFLVSMLALLLVAPSLGALADEDDGRPVLTPQLIQVNAGDTFDLEVSVQAWTSSNHTMTFQNRSRFAYPGSRSVTHSMERGDAILFKVTCSVEEDAPDGDYPIAFKVEWDDNGTLKKVEDEIEVKVGEGAGSDDICASSVMLAAPAVLVFSLLMVQRRRTRY